jgi:hypothetical protein
LPGGANPEGRSGVGLPSNGMEDLSAIAEPNGEEGVRFYCRIDITGCMFFLKVTAGQKTKIE